MDANEKINQLVGLMADLVPTVDKLTRMQERTNVEMHEMRTSNMKLAGAIESLIDRIDKLNDFENRLTRIEKIVLK